MAAEPGPTDADLADLLDKVLDFACDADQCRDPWMDETLRPLRALAERLRRWHRPYSLGDYPLRPRSVTLAAAMVPEDTTITVTDARHLLPGDLIEIDYEVMEVTAAPILSTSSIAVARARRGTIATGHAPGALGRLTGNTRAAAAERSRRVREVQVLAPAPGADDDAERAALERTRLLDDAERLLDELEARAPDGGAGRA